MVEFLKFSYSFYGAHRECYKNLIKHTSLDKKEALRLVDAGTSAIPNYFANSDFIIDEPDKEDFCAIVINTIVNTPYLDDSVYDFCNDFLKEYMSTWDPIDLSLSGLNIRLSSSSI